MSTLHIDKLILKVCALLWQLINGKGYHLFFQALCEVHFDENPRFKVHFTDEFIKTDNIGALRLHPEGHDMHGNAIWYQQVC